MCQHFSKTEGECLLAMKQAAKEAFENNMHYNDTMKTSAEAIGNVLFKMQFTMLSQN